MNSAATPRGLLQLAEPVLEQVVRAVEVGAQAPDRGGAVSPLERIPSRGAEELAVDADQQARGDARVARVDAELALDGVGQHLPEAGHDLALLRQQRGRLFD